MLQGFTLKKSIDLKMLLLSCGIRHGSFYIYSRDFARNTLYMKSALVSISDNVASYGV